LLLCKSVFDGDVLSLDPAKFVQLLPERFHEDRHAGSSAIIEETYAEDFRWLLRLGGKTKWKRKSEESKARNFSIHHVSSRLLHLITLSARASTFGGIVRPICFAALRLIINSNFIGCSTGRSAGLRPLRILSTYVAARRNMSGALCP